MVSQMTSKWCLLKPSERDSTCVLEGCFGPRNYGFVKGEPLFCRQHRGVGCINMSRKMCEAGPCTTFASYGVHYKQPLYCKLHKRESDRNVIKEKWEPVYKASSSCHDLMSKEDPFLIFSFDEDRWLV